MQYLNIELWRLRATEFIESPHADVATWLRLLAHCAEQENGGLIRNAEKWKDRQWGQIGLTANDVNHPSPLWSFSVGHLRVWGYPKDQEAALIAKRKGGAFGASKRWGGKVVEMPKKYRSGDE